MTEADIKEVNIKYVEGMLFSARTDSGHEVLMDADPKFGGADKGPRPMDLLLAGLGGCTAMDIISILKKKKQEVTGLEIKVKGERAPEHPKKYTGIELEFRVKGKNISEDAVKRAVGLSMDKYCSAKATIEGGAKVTYAYRIEE
ncbi:MAG: OsmC family protein [Nitrospiraceae bacterium]|nr:OsmC family protein [Nitrospiraceae bacterium]